MPGWQLAFLPFIKFRREQCEDFLAAQAIQVIGEIQLAEHALAFGIA